MNLMTPNFRISAKQAAKLEAQDLRFSLTVNTPAEAFYRGLARRLELSWIL